MSPNFNPFPERLALRILCLSVAFYVLVFYFFCCLKYYAFAYDDFDLAIHDQIIWNMLHGNLFNSILGINFLGNHVHFISFLVAPLYALYPHPLFLLFLQTVFLAAGVFPLYYLARTYLGVSISVTVCLVYLLYPGLGYTNLYEFHPTSFAVFFLLCTAYYFYKKQFFLFNVFMVLSLLCQENIALIFIMWGIYAFILRRPWPWVLVPLVAGLIYFLVCVYIILPTFNKNTFNFFQIYSPLGHSLAEVIRTCVTHPAFVWSYVFESHKVFFLYLLFLSVSFAPLFSPMTLMPSVFIFAQHLLSSRPSEISLHYHYTAELIPFMFMGLVFGLKKIIGSSPHSRYLAGILLFNALLVNLALGPQLHLIKEFKRMHVDERAAQQEWFMQQVPKEASVVATFKFLPHLSHRQGLYSFHHVYSGFYTLFTKLYHLPDNVQYALIDFNDGRTFRGFYRTSNFRHMVDFFKGASWGALAAQDSIVLFKKGIKDRYSLFKLSDNHVVPAHGLNVIIDKSIKLYGYDLHQQADRLDLTLYWKSLKPESKDINLVLDFRDPNGRLIDRQYRPICYRIWPTHAWQPGQALEDHVYVTLSFLKGHSKILTIGFFNWATAAKVLASGPVNIELNYGQ